MLWTGSLSFHRITSVHEHLNLNQSSISVTRQTVGQHSSKHDQSLRLTAYVVEELKIEKVNTLHNLYFAMRLIILKSLQMTAFWLCYMHYFCLIRDHLYNKDSSNFKAAILEIVRNYQSSYFRNSEKLSTFIGQQTFLFFLPVAKFGIVWLTYTLFFLHLIK